MDKMSLEAIKILLIEDNPGDIELLRIGFEDAKISNEISTISDGEEAIAYFEQCGNDDFASRPDIVLLDINLPKVDGFEILHKIRSTPNCKNLPVIMLTSSEASADIARGYAEQANCFLSKPVEFDKFLDVVKSLENFWLTVVKLPTSSNEISSSA